MSYRFFVTIEGRALLQEKPGEMRRLSALGVLRSLGKDDVGFGDPLSWEMGTVENFDSMECAGLV